MASFWVFYYFFFPLKREQESELKINGRWFLYLREDDDGERQLKKISRRCNGKVSCHLNFARHFHSNAFRSLQSKTKHESKRYKALKDTTLQ